MNIWQEQRSSPDGTRVALGIAFIYLIIGVLWIFFSDRLLFALVSDPDLRSRIEIYKGWFYVSLTAALLFLLIRRGIQAVSKSREEARVRARQQEAVAEMGLRALAGGDLPSLMRETLSSMASILNVEYGSVLEVAPDGEAFLVRAAFGWEGDAPGGGKIPLHPDSPAGLTLVTGQPVVIRDLSVETRFRPVLQFLDRGIMSGVSVVIQGKEKPYGVLTARSIRPRDFTRDDVNFVQAVANMLAAAIVRSEAESRLRLQLDFTGAITDCLAEGVFALDTQGRLTFMNAAAEKVLGWSEADLLGTDMHKATHTRRPDGSLLPADECPIYAVMGKGEVYQTDEDVFITREGRAVPVAYSSSPITTNGSIRGAVVAFREVTERKQSEEALRLSEQRFRAVFESALDPMLIADDQSNFLDANTAACALIGVSKEELRGKSLADFVPTEQRGEMRYLWKLFLRQGELQGEFQVLRPDGHTRHLEYGAKANFLPGQHLAVLRDITLRKKMEEALEVPSRGYHTDNV